MLDISIKTIPHGTQNYSTVGDYHRDGHRLNIRVSGMNNKDYEFLVAVHEMIESYLCEKHKIPFDKITAFDIEFEDKRKEGNLDEPGDDPKAPYKTEHRFAENIERQLAHELNVNWTEYNKTVEEL